jgi:DNA-binding response OmpR family regulator
MVGGRDIRDARGSESILVFDDEQVILDFLAEVLTRHGYRVTTTPCGEEALQLFARHRFDLAIADLGLRRRDGRNLVRRIKQLSPQTSVVAMSAYPERDAISFAEGHTEAFLTKPFGMGELLSAVRQALGRRLLPEVGHARALVPAKAYQ